MQNDVGLRTGLDRALLDILPYNFPPLPLFFSKAAIMVFDTPPKFWKASLSAMIKAFDANTSRMNSTCLAKRSITSESGMISHSTGCGTVILEFAAASL